MALFQAFTKSIVLPGAHCNNTKSTILKKIVFLIIAVSLSNFLHAQKLLRKHEAAVQQTVVNFFEALSNRDSVSLKNHSTADIALYENGSTWNVDTLIAKAITLNPSTDFKRINKVDFINTNVDKNTAWATYNLHSAITRNGKQSNVLWLETVVMVKEQKKWKIKVLHTTLIKRS